MFAQSVVRILLLVLASGTAFSVPLRAEENGQAGLPREGLLVLTNGRVIQGLIAADGEYFKVVLPKGKLSVRVDQVEFLCQSKEEAYVRRRARKITVAATADAHLEMARWCMQLDLLAYAAAEVAAARDCDPDHWLLPSTERQLAETRKLHQRAPSIDPAINDDCVEAASFEIETSGQAFGDIPPWARTEFIKRIQPMMAHSCATAGCHLPKSSQELQIDRLALDGVGNPELIHRNLTSTVAMIDLAEPEDSLLLVMGATRHGVEGNQSRPLAPHQLEILRAWLTQLAHDEPPQEQRDATPVTQQIVVGMAHGQSQKLILDAASAAPDPFDPAEFNQSQDATPTSEVEAATPQAEETAPEPTP